MTQYEPVFFDLETTGLNPMAQSWWDSEPEARITAIGVGVMKGWREASDWDGVETQVECFMDDSEYELLRYAPKRTWEMVKELHGEDVEPILVGYNSRQFDHPYYGARAARLRLDGTPFASGWKRLDIQRVAGRDNSIGKKYPKEDEYAETLGIEVTDQFTGADMPKAWEKGEKWKIEEHVTLDVEDLMKVFYARRELSMDTFFDHYGINAEASYADSIGFREPTEAEEEMEDPFSELNHD